MNSLDDLLIWLLIICFNCKNCNNSLTESVCDDTAFHIISQLDTSVNPCSDFYKFACGNSDIDFFKHLEIYTLMSINSELRKNIKKRDIKPFQMVKKFFQTCLDTDAREKEGIEPALKLLEKLGGWPLLNDDYDESEFDLMKTLQLLNENGFNEILVSININVNPGNPPEYKIFLDPPQFGTQIFHLRDGLGDDSVEAYFLFMVEMAIMFGAKRLTAITDLRECLRFEINLAKLFKHDEPEMMSLPKLQRKYKDISWEKLFNSILPENVFENEEIVIMAPHYYQNLQALINKTPKTVLANYIMWRVVQEVTEYLNEETNDFLTALKKKANIVKQRLGHRDFDCTLIINNLIPHVLGAMYAQKVLKKKTKEEALIMVDLLKEEFREILKTAAIMDETTKQRAIQKLDAVINCTGYPDEFLNDGKLEEFYSELSIKEQFFEMAMDARKFKSKLTFSKIHKTVDKNDWRREDNYLEASASYYLSLNVIVIPIGVLNWHMYDINRPNYINYGKLGWAIGHEIAHGFTERGRLFDENGIESYWWTQESDHLYSVKSNCIKNQYNNFYIPEMDMKVYRSKTVGENIADNVGIKQAYRAYKKYEQLNGPEQKLPGLNYTAHQLFWIAAAQVFCTNLSSKALIQEVLYNNHSPKKYRVLGTFENNEDFAKDFNCPLGSPMNPKKKCTIY